MNQKNPNYHTAHKINMTALFKLFDQVNI